MLFRIIAVINLYVAIDKFIISMNPLASILSSIYTEYSLAHFYLIYISDLSLSHFIYFDHLTSCLLLSLSISITRV